MPTPLITSRSPSFGRAQAHLADPEAARVAELIGVASRLVELEENASRLCTGRLAAHHLARREKVAALVFDLGGAPPRSDETRDLIEPGESVALRLGEAYAEALSDPRWTPDQRDLLWSLAG